MRVKGIGRIELLPDSIKDVLSRLDNATKDYSNHFTLTIEMYSCQCLN